MQIKPINYFFSSHKTDSISGYTQWQIQKLLGFPPNVKDDSEKVVYSWRFSVDGKECAIWDYHRSHKMNRWSAYDPHQVLHKLFLLESRKTFWA
jgi:hypothetical protein